METATMSPNEQHESRSSPAPLLPTPAPNYHDSAEKLTHLRFLVSNAAAGAVIGKGGFKITEFQQQTGARILLSRLNEFFPGTSDRIVLVSGKSDEVLNAVELVLSELQLELNVEDNSDPRARVRLVVPNHCCGGLIGKGGSTIKSLSEESGAGIKVSQDLSSAGLTDRLVSVTGTLDEQMHAIDLILSVLAENPRYPQSMEFPYTYAGIYVSGSGSSPYPSGPASVASSQRVPGMKFRNKEEQSYSVTIHVADEYMGLVVGRGGKNLREISQISGAVVKVSDKGDFMPGTADRKVTITGSLIATRAAQEMIMRKVSHLSVRKADQI